jgi:Transcriptional regulators
MQIKRKKLYEEVISGIIGMIKANNMKSGDKLSSEKELGSLFGVSRMVIREALSALQSNGFVEVKHGSGIYLKKIDDLVYNNDLEAYSGKQKIIKIIEFRKGLESEAAYLAALRCTEQDKLYLEENLHKMLQAVSSGQNASEEDYQFHATLMTASHNTFYEKIFNDIIQPSYYDILKSGHSFFAKTIGPRLVVVQEHQEIFEFIKSSRANEARQAMWYHLDSVEVKMRNLLHVYSR